MNLKINTQIIIQKYKIIIIVLACLITLGIVVFIILPVGKDIKRINEDIYHQRVTLEKLYLRSQSIKQAKEDYEKIKDEIKTLDNVFYSPGQELEFITDLEKIANQQSIKQIINIKETGDESESLNYQTLKIELNLIGTLSNILNYLDQVQTMNSYFNIDYLKFYNPNARAFSDSTLFETSDINYIKSKTSQNITVIMSGLTYWK